MGMSVTQLLIILVIVIVLFGTKRLRNIGSDLGGAIKSFRSAIKEGEEDKQLAGGEQEKTKETSSSERDKV
ncbi:MAG: hypothetical protein Kow0065_16910 [Methylomicrobium sp.]